MANDQHRLGGRRSIRRKGYDYSVAGVYFVTICCQGRVCRFGRVENGEMCLNDPGRMVERWCAELPNKFPHILIDTYIVMPNHIHAIIVNHDDAHLVREDGQPHGLDDVIVRDGVLGEHRGSPLHRVVQWFKTMTTNEYIRGVRTLEWQPFDRKLWQRNYHERIIGDDRWYRLTVDYIMRNPAQWGRG